jgi:hypothetical protein
MIRYGGNARQNGWICKFRLNKWLDMVEKTGEMDESANWDETND